MFVFSSDDIKLFITLSSIKYIKCKTFPNMLERSIHQKQCQGGSHREPMVMLLQIELNIVFIEDI